MPAQLANVQSYIQVMSGDSQAGRQSFERRIGQDVEHLAAQEHTWAGWIRLTQGDLAFAVWHFRGACHQRQNHIPQCPVEGLIIAQLLSDELGETSLSLLNEKLRQTSQPLFMRMLNLDPLAFPLAVRAWTLARCDQPDEARKEAVAAEAKINKIYVHHAAKVHWCLAMAYQQLGDPEQSRRHSQNGTSDSGWYGDLCRELLQR